MTDSDGNRVITTVISIHTLRVEGDFFCNHSQYQLLSISIHTLRVEGDCNPDVFVNFNATFQSTPSVWRVTITAVNNPSNPANFNPHPPCGG